MSNSLVLVAREEVHPSIEGVDFGGIAYVLARTETVHGKVEIIR